MVGRAVWTDERGDQVFSELRGEGTAARQPDRRDVPRRHRALRGATGTYEFSWRYVLEAEDGTRARHAVGLKGACARAAGAGGGAQR